MTARGALITDLNIAFFITHVPFFFSCADKSIHRPAQSQWRAGCGSSCDTLNFTSYCYDTHKLFVSCAQTFFGHLQTIQPAGRWPNGIQLGGHFGPQTASFLTRLSTSAINPPTVLPASDMSSTRESRFGVITSSHSYPSLQLAHTAPSPCVGFGGFNAMKSRHAAMRTPTGGNGILVAGPNSWRFECFGLTCRITGQVRQPLPDSNTVIEN